MLYSNVDDLLASGFNSENIDIYLTENEFTSDVIDYIITNYDNFHQGIMLLKHGGLITQDIVEKNISKFQIDIRFLANVKNLDENFILKYCCDMDFLNIVIYQKLSYEFIRSNIYKFSLYLADIDRCVNLEHITRLKSEYPDKYEIDELAYNI